MYRCLSCNRSCGISWEGIAFFQSCFVSLCPRGNSDIIDMILWSHPVWKLPSEFKSMWSSAGNACTSKKKYMNFAYIFDNIRFFFWVNCCQLWHQKYAVKILGKSNIFILFHGVFVCLHVLTKQLCFEFIRYIWYFCIHAAHIFIRYFHLLLSKNCSYSRTHATLTSFCAIFSCIVLMALVVRIQLLIL